VSVPPVTVNVPQGIRGAGLVVGYNADGILSVTQASYIGVDDLADTITGADTGTLNVSGVRSARCATTCTSATGIPAPSPSRAPKHRRCSPPRPAFLV
jgi:hypothetical protein